MIRKQNLRKRLRLRTAIFLVVSSLIVLLGGGVTLLWQVHQGQPTRAADPGSPIVAGPPSLPASLVDSILANMGSPMAGTGSVVEQTSRQMNIDDAFALAVWWTETNDGAAGVGRADRNPGSIRGSAGYPAAFDGYTIYPSYSAAIVDWFNVLQGRYVSRGLTSVYTICRPYVATATACLGTGWAGKVMGLMARYRGEAPPPPPTPTVTPSPSPTHPALHSVEDAQQKLTRLEVSPGKSMQPRNAMIRNTVSTTSPSAQALSSSQTMLSGFALLIAIVLAFWAMLMRRSIPALSLPKLEDAPLASQLQMPPLYVNQFSQLLQDQVVQNPFGPPTVVAAASGGLLSNYSSGEARPHRVRLLPSRGGDEGRGNPTTDSVAFSSGLSLPGRTPEPVSEHSNGSGGLLRRYGSRVS